MPCYTQYLMCVPQVASASTGISIDLQLAARLTGQGKKQPCEWQMDIQSQVKGSIKRSGRRCFINFSDSSDSSYVQFEKGSSHQWGDRFGHNPGPGSITNYLHLFWLFHQQCLFCMVDDEFHRESSFPATSKIARYPCNKGYEEPISVSTWND